MDYEKKYKEALERFKTFREKYCTYGELHFGDVIFDKTGEAQKDLDAIFPELRESEDEKIRKGLIELIENWNYPQELFTTKQNIIAYLEKQKEPHYTKRNALFEKCVANCDPEIMKKVSDEIDSRLKKEQKPAEWSKEDEKNRRNLMSLLANMRGDRITEETYQKYYPWLKDLRPSWKPSEEQMGALENARYMMSQSADYYDTVQILDSLINDLKKLI